MKLMKRVVTLMLTAFLVAGVFAPVQTEAASLSVAGIKFYSWSGAGECFMVTKAQNIYEFQYQIFNNAGTYVKTKKSLVYHLNSDPGKYDICLVEELPKLSCSFVRVRARSTPGGWCAWSQKRLIVPLLGVAGKVNATKAGDRKAKISWSPVTGAYDYLVYMSTTGTGGWKKVATVKGNAKSRSVVISSFNGKRLALNQQYYYKVITRRKMAGQYYSSNGNTSKFYVNWFKFYLTY